VSGHGSTIQLDAVCFDVLYWFYVTGMFKKQNEEREALQKEREDEGIF